MEPRLKFASELAIIQGTQIRIEKKVDAVLGKMVSKYEAQEEVQKAHECKEHKVDALAAGVEKTAVVSDSVKQIVNGTIEEDRAEKEELQRKTKPT